MDKTSTTPEPVQKFASALQSYASSPPALKPGDDEPEQALIRCLLFFLIPVWNTSGVLDWLWHKQTDIEHTAGLEESLIHLLMFAEAGIPLYMGLLLEVNAGVLLTMLGALGLHQATAFWDVHYAEGRRQVTEREQHTHSFLEVLPVAAFAMAACLHWDQAKALFGAGSARPDFSLKLKKKHLPLPYLAALTGIMAVGIGLPYGNEVWRCFKVRQQPHGDGRKQA
jgi:hypothetical protein